MQAYNPSTQDAEISLDRVKVYLKKKKKLRERNEEAKGQCCHLSNSRVPSAQMSGLEMPAPRSKSHLG